MSTQSVGLVGLGLMGTAIAGRLLERSFAVVGYDVDSARCDALAEHGGRVAAGPAEVASSCDRVILSLPASDIVESVIAAMEPQLRPGQTIVDTTTGDPVRVAALGPRLDERGVAYLDATVSGSSAETAHGEVIVIAGGRREVFEACTDLFAAFARRWFHAGGWGSGTRTKLAVNLVLGLNRAALAEGLSLARAQGLDAAATLAVLRESAAYSRVMDAKGDKMVRGDFTPQARLAQHLKDVRLMLDAAARAGIELPLSRLHRELLEALVAAGLGDADNCAVIEAFRRGAST